MALRILCLVCALLATDALAQPKWAIDPAQAGPNVPSIGRSLFDHATAHWIQGQYVQRVPYPFDALIKLVRAKANCGQGASCSREVLIPLGRSLQRTSASPDFFKFPRAVVAVTGERGQASLYLKDRLFLGYQEKANLIEVISYNETAARFEFQLVKDYRAGGRAQVVYANRVLCLACHQNQAPIFSRQVWDETNANPRVSAKLSPHGRFMYGIPVALGIDAPDAIDASVARANEFSVTRVLWSGCGTDDACRAGVLIAAAQFRLNGDRTYDASAPEFLHVKRSISANARLMWPAGLAIPNAAIPNRDPFQQRADARGVGLTHVGAALEPLQPRQPTEVMTQPDLMADRLVKGVAGMLSAADVRALRHRIAAQGGRQRTLRAPCHMEKLRRGYRFSCLSNDLSLSGRRTGEEGIVDAISTRPGGLLRHFELRTRGQQAKVLVPKDADLRLEDGNALKRIVLDAASRTVSLDIVDDFSDFAGQLAVPPAELNRSNLLKALSLARSRDHVRLPPALEETETPAPNPRPSTHLFHRHCAACHRTRESTPPNFLHGDEVRVEEALRHCAVRIYVRLTMGLLPKHVRAKTPMPPALASRAGSPAALQLSESIVHELRAAIGPFMPKTASPGPSAGDHLEKNYESLPPCLSPEPS